MTPDEIALLRNTAYHTYRLSMQSTPLSSVYFQRMSNPIPGDLVFEVTTHYVQDAARCKNVPAVGYLLRVIREEITLDEEDRKQYLDYGEAIPTERVWYIKPLDESFEEIRWVNADFITIPSWQEPLNVPR